MKRPPARKRRAMVLLMLILAFAALSVLAVAMARMFVFCRQVQTQQEEHLQAVLLAEAGVERAAIRLHDDPQFSGETWKVTPDELGLREAATVQITVAAVDDAPAQRSVTSTATLGTADGDSAEITVKHRREARLTIASP